MRFLLLLMLAAAGAVRADVLNLSNGDRFVGHVETMSATEVQLKSDVLGLVKIPRAKVASIYFGTNQPPSEVKAATTGEDPAAKVQKDFLATATPEANEMFTKLAQGLASGKISVDDIRKQAADTLKELRELESDLGDDAENPLLKSYSSILEKFIAAGRTNRTPAITNTVPHPAKKSPE